MPHKTLGEIASLVGGEVIEPSAADKIIQGVCSIADGRPDEITFFANKKYISSLKTSQAGAVLVAPDFAFDVPPVVLRVENPSIAFATVAALFAPAPTRYKPGIHPCAVVHEGAQIGPGASLAAGVVVESGAVIGANTVLCANVFVGREARVGEDCLVYSNASVRERVTIGNRVIIHCGAVIGSDGFGYELVQGRHQKIPQIGTVQIDDDVEIGANTTIDRARFGRTWIQEGTKIDNLVQIAHNVVIGRHCIIVSQVGISGSTRLGDYATLGGQVGVAGHLEIGARAMVGAQSGISKNVPAGEMWNGTPATTLKESHESMARVRRLEKLTERVKRLEDALGGHD